MLPENLAVRVIDVLSYHQKKEKVRVFARSFTAMSLRYETAGKYISKDKCLAFEPVSICIIPEGVSYIRSSEEEDVLVIHFHAMNHVFEEIQIFRVEDGEKYHALFRKALEIKTENDLGSIYRITSIVYEIFSELIRDGGFGDNPKDSRIAEAAEYMRQNFWNSELSVEALAKRAAISQALFRREFHRVYGTSPKAYLDNLRIQYAKSLLETKYFSQKEIAARCGYSDVAYFRAVFKRKFGRSIREYLAIREEGT